MFLMAALLLAGLFFGTRWALIRPREAQTELALPAGERPEYTLHLRYGGTDDMLAVTEEIAWVNREDARLDSVCLRVNAAAYAEEAASPAAAADIFERAYPGGFDAAAFILEGCWVNEELSEAEMDTEQANLLWVRRAVDPGERVLIRLRYRIRLPECAALFGRAGDTVRLLQALPTVAARYGGAWDTAPTAPYAAPQAMEPSDVRITADLAGGLRLAEGAGSGTDQLSLLILPDTLAEAEARLEGMTVMALADTRDRAEKLLAAARKIWPAYVRRYGRLPLEKLTLVSLPLPDTGYSAPGLTLLDSAVTDAELEYRLAYWLAGQWFGWAVSADEARETWLTCSTRQWAALRYARETGGADAEERLRRLWVELPMRENLHAAVTPGTPADGFPDLTTFRAVMDGRACAFLYALDELTHGGLDALLGRLVQENAFQRVGRDTLLRAVYDACGRDAAPLMADWLDTYIMETP